MALRSNHYDAAFEAFLRQERRPYVAVDETKRALVPGSSLKSLDFIVYSLQGRNLLVDVKGRKFPSGSDADPGRLAEAVDITQRQAGKRRAGKGSRPAGQG